MLNIRPAAKKDEMAILGILKELDLFYPALALDGFWVAEKDGEVIATVQLTDLENFAFLGSLAVKKKEQGKGVAAALLNRVLGQRSKDIYLYTVIPDFFEKFGFEPTSPQPGLPSKDRYECEYCHSDKCVTMVRQADAA